MTRWTWCGGQDEEDYETGDDGQDVYDTHVLEIILCWSAIFYNITAFMIALATLLQKLNAQCI